VAAAQKPWIVPIPGTRKMVRLEDNLGAAAVELPADDLGDTDAATATIEVHSATQRRTLVSECIAIIRSKQESRNKER
jgi:diketogulonate reductase-like aldo/keto reductase